MLLTLRDTASARDSSEKEDDMEEENIRDLNEKVLGNFMKSFSKRYEQWRRKDVLSVALNTLPKQIKKENVANNLLKFKADFQKKLKNEG